MTHRFSATLPVILILALAPIAEAQELMPLAQWLKRSANEQEPSYLFVRCSGYYMSIMKYAGAKFSKEEQDGFTWTSITLAFAAAQVRHSKDGSKMPLKDYTENVTKDVKRIADEYVKRMQRNYARSGNAVTDDQLIIGDGETCKAIAEEVGRNAR
jgi:hypothetical protein